MINYFIQYRAKGPQGEFEGEIPITAERPITGVEALRSIAGVIAGQLEKEGIAPAGSLIVSVKHWQRFEEPSLIIPPGTVVN